MDASIVIPVKNGASYITECLESCFAQKTTYEFEIILIDDNSSDNTVNLAEQFNDTRGIPFRILRSRGSGISDALNTGISESCAEFIIRIDADDKMKQDRLQKQISYAKSQPNLVLLGSQIEFIGNFNPARVPNFYPLSDSEIRKKLSQGCYFAHPSVLIRKSALDHLCGYNPQMDGAEDYELWLLLSSQGEMENSSDVLTEYRVHPNQFTVSQRKNSLLSTAKVRIFFIFRLKRFRRVSKNHFGKISRFNMSVVLLLEVARFFVGALRTRNKNV